MNSSESERDIVHEALERAAERERARLLAEGAGDEALERDARARLEQLTRGGGATRRRAWPWLALAAAAALAFAWLATRPEPAPEPPPDLPLGAGDELRLLPPRYEDGALRELRWTFDLPAGGWYELTLTTPDGVETLRGPLELDEPRWRATSNDDLPEEFRWEVRAYDANRERIGGASAELRP